jgi:hypothetical protein
LTSIRHVFAYLRPSGALLVLLAAVAIAPSPASAKEECWRTLVEDWNDGAISNLYPISCYRQALANMPEDVRLYSSAGDDINRALNGRVATRGLAGSSSGNPGGAQVAAAATGAGGSGMPFALVGSLAVLLLFAGAAAYLIHREWRGAARLRAPRDP